MAHFVIDKNSPYEKFYRTPDGKLIFNAIPSIGAENTVDYSELRNRMAKHFYLGDGWPKGHPKEIREETILVAFRNERIKNQQAH